GDGYWGLKYFNRSSQFPDCPDDLYTFARFQNGSGRLLVVAANFRSNSDLQGQVRIPEPLAAVVNFPTNVTVHLLLDRGGARNSTIAEQTRESLSSLGFSVSLPNQACHVYAIG